ncbi:hypothetical protein P171DRAFT_29303 [Karstenula rhodostoma CBS 690.94]|uniref:Uncharacterized protein n=1 Tax=Karstenula rhodostoma CBS 690.94 TaxID=1392251 RepID=A0A9P4PHX2_9PLEO|nr:hypothetical protein P171DRAFT_29303 [Karstenula rhodostoma CBS 690.94]
MSLRGGPCGFCTTFPYSRPKWMAAWSVPDQGNCWEEYFVIRKGVRKHGGGTEIASSLQCKHIIERPVPHLHTQPSHGSSLSAYAGLLPYSNTMVPLHKAHGAIQPITVFSYLSCCSATICWYIRRANMHN